MIAGVIDLNWWLLGLAVALLVGALVAWGRVSARDRARQAEYRAREAELAAYRKAREAELRARTPYRGTRRGGR